MEEVKHSPMFDKINHWYNECVPAVWTKDMVYRAVPKMITPEEYEEIVGEPYIPVNNNA